MAAKRSCQALSSGKLRAQSSSGDGKAATKGHSGVKLAGQGRDAEASLYEPRNGLFLLTGDEIRVRIQAVIISIHKTITDPKSTGLVKRRSFREHEVMNIPKVQLRG